MVLNGVLPPGTAIHDQAKDVERIGAFRRDGDARLPGGLRQHLTLDPGALAVVLDTDRTQVGGSPEVVYCFLQ
jgi:hypothetical protein